MSDEKPKPFAVVRPETSVADAEGFSVVIEGYECCPPWGNWSAQGSADYAAAINAAVAAERRDAVVAKLRELSRTARGLTLANGGYAASEWLAKEADAVERGE